MIKTNQKTSPLLRSPDFWLVGGILITLWLPFQVLEYFRADFPSIQSSLLALTRATPLILLAVNFPHFAASYFLAYFRSPRFYFQHWFALILVPLFLAAGLFWNFVLYLHPDQFVQAKWITGLFLFLMLLTVKWHYAKQTYGCTIASSQQAHYSLDVRQKDLLRYSLLAFGWYHWGLVSINRERHELMGFDFPTIGIPISFKWFGGVIVFVLVFLLITQVAEKNKKEKSKWPPAQAQASFWSFPLSMFAAIQSGEYFSTVVPAFHSLQYLFFVFRRLKARWSRENKNPTLRLLFWFIVMCLVGNLAFNSIPHWVAKTVSPGSSLESVTTVLALIFINIHHYFIDHVIWRRTDPELKAWSATERVDALPLFPAQSAL